RLFVGVGIAPLVPSGRDRVDKDERIAPCDRGSDAPIDRRNKGDGTGVRISGRDLNGQRLGRVLRLAHGSHSVDATKDCEGDESYQFCLRELTRDEFFTELAWPRLIALEALVVATALIAIDHQHSSRHFAHRSSAIVKIESGLLLDVSTRNGAVE